MSHNVRDWIESSAAKSRAASRGASMTTDQDMQTARSEGFQAGANAGSWVFDGNSSAKDARRIAQGYDDGDPEVMDLEPQPLSGEWAGQSISELSAEFGIDLSNDDLADEFECGFSDGFWQEVLASADHIVDSQQ